MPTLNLNSFSHLVWKFVVSGRGFNMTFLLLFIQSFVCVLLVVVCKKLRIIQYGEFNIENAKKWYPISACLVIVIYTGSKSLVRTAPVVARAFGRLPEQILTFGCAAISQYTGVHHLQKPHHHSNCVYRIMVPSYPATDGVNRHMAK